MLSLIDVIHCGYCGRKLTNGTKYAYWTIKDTGEKRTSKTPVYRCRSAQIGIPHNKATQFRADKIGLVTLEGEPIHLTQIEYKLVSLLARNAGRVLTYDFILKDIWGPYADTDNQILRVNMANIRRKLEKNPAEPHYIFTEIGVGYRMIE